LGFAGGNVYLFFLTSFEVIVKFTSINIDGEFWFPCLKIFLDEFPGVNINARFACNDSCDIVNFACCESSFDVLSNDEGGAVSEGSSDEENVKLHYDFKGPAFRLIVG
jgi:hypothetical protein